MTPLRIKAIRRRLGVTQRQLAERLNVHVVTVKKWETGAYPIGRSAAVRLWLLEQNAGAESAAAEPIPGEDLVQALSQPDGGGAIGVARTGEGAEGSIQVGKRTRRFVRYDCPGRVPGVVFAFEDLDGDEFEEARVVMLERAIASSRAARVETAPARDRGPRPKRGSRPQWVRADWLRK